MENTEIQEAIDKSVKLQLKNKQLADHIITLISTKEHSDTITIHNSEFEINKIEILRLRTSIGSFYAVWQGKIKDGNFIPQRVASPPFNIKDDAEHHLTKNLKSSEIIGKKEFSVFNTTVDAKGKFVGHY
jgi:hypothetical protein